MRRKTGKPPFAFQGGSRGNGAVFADAAGHPYVLPMDEAVSALGGGDVHGPGSATDGDLAVFDGTSGKHLKDTGAKAVDVPSDDEKAALAGTNGTPSVTNKYVTDSDPRLVAAGFTVLTADPGSPANDTYWVRRTGASPAMDVEVRVRIAGTTYTLAGITI
jgi:hypothetical protein